MIYFCIHTYPYLLATRLTLIFYFKHFNVSFTTQMYCSYFRLKSMLLFEMAPLKTSQTPQFQKRKENTVTNSRYQPFLNPDNSPKDCSNLRSIFSRKITEPWVLWHFKCPLPVLLPPAQGSLQNHRSWNQVSFETSTVSVTGRCRLGLQLFEKLPS